MAFPGRIIIDETETALSTASEWSRPDTIWTDGSRQDNGTVGVACVWRTHLLPATEPTPGDTDTAASATALQKIHGYLQEIHEYFRTEMNRAQAIQVKGADRR